MKAVTDTGLVLRRARHLENDARLILLLRDHGKFSLVSKGSAHLKSKLKNLQEPFSEVDVQVFIPPQGTHGRLTGGKLIHSFEKIRQSYDSYLVAYACAEVVDALLPFRAPSPEVFDILRDTFCLLEKSVPAREAWIGFVHGIIKTLGHGDISEKLKNYSLGQRFDLANGELEQILPWQLKSDLSSLRLETVVQS